MEKDSAVNTAPVSGKDLDDVPKDLNSDTQAEPEQLEAPEAPADPEPERKTIFGF